MNNSIILRIIFTNNAWLTYKTLGAPENNLIVKEEPVPNYGRDCKNHFQRICECTISTSKRRQAERSNQSFLENAPQLFNPKKFMGSKKVHIVELIHEGRQLYIFTIPSHPSTIWWQQTLLARSPPKIETKMKFMGFDERKD